MKTLIKYNLFLASLIFVLHQRKKLNLKISELMLLVLMSGEVLNLVLVHTFNLGWS